MISNHIKTAWRNIAGSLGYSAINIFGLAAGLASFVVILLYMNYELSYDKWNPELQKVYRVSMRIHEDYSLQTPAPLPSLLVEKYPNAEAATSMQSAGDFDILVSANDKKIYQKNILTVDSGFLKVFPYHLSSGEVSTALNQPNAAVISEELSHKLFGDVNPLGKPIKVYNALTCVVTGVMQRPIGPSHLPVEMLMRDPNGKQNNHWENYSFQTYIKIRHPEADQKIEDDINSIYYSDHLKKDNRTFEAYKKSGQQTALIVDVVPDIYNFPKHGSSHFTTVSVLLVLAILLLLAGAINFSNLAIAKSMKRAKEVGVRKVLGSNRRQLIQQFMTETAVQCVASLAIALVLVNLALPYINQAFSIKLSFWQQHNTGVIILQVLICLFIVTLLSGLYPSLFLSRFNTTKVLKGDYSTGKTGRLFRNSLIVVQFMVSAFFIISILLISGQMNYMQNKDKGFSNTQVMRIQAMQKTREEGFNAMQNSLLAIPGVEYISKTTKVPGDHLFVDTSTYGFKYAGKDYRMASVKVSKDYFKTLGVKLLKGREFTNEPGDQNTRMAVINESAAKLLNLTDPIGKVITFPSCDSIPVQIIGLVKDFNVEGFEAAVQPNVYTIGNQACMYQSGGAILVKINSHHVQQSVAAIEQQWKRIEPDFPMQYTFLDQNFRQMLESYFRLQKVIAFFAIVAIVISVMGLFALTAFFTLQRKKEISIRKVLGASVTQLTTLLSREFVYLVLIAVLIISPIAWWCGQQWLQTFAYRINISCWIFITAGAIAVLIALLTVSFQSIKTALANPVKSLKSE